MNWKIPKNTDKYYWTQHVVGKMRQYGLSEQKVLGVIRRPKRIETGIAPDTVAVMQPTGSIKYDGKKEVWKQEIWVMYQLKTNNSQLTTNNKFTSKNKTLQKLQASINSKKKITIISAWRFPGVSPEKDPIPAEIWREIEELTNLH